jgi:hypothetical protein
VQKRFRQDTPANHPAKIGYPVQYNNPNFSAKALEKVDFPVADVPTTFILFIVMMIYLSLVNLLQDNSIGSVG